MNAQSLADGAAGIALLHAERGDWAAANQAIKQATADGVSIAAGASLFYGAPAIAFVLSTASHPQLARARSIAAAGTVTVIRQRIDEAHRRIDHKQQPHFREYDLIRGLTGLGVAARRLGEHELLRDILDYFVRLTEPISGLPGWWCHHGPDRSQPAPPGGHANHGLAHGITGPLALLAMAHRDGLTSHSHTNAITTICSWLDTWQQHSSTGTWWPQTLALAELDSGVPAQLEPLRPSWCYGTPGIARAQQLAALATQDATRQQMAEAALAACIKDPAQVSRLADRSLCHGTAGILTTARQVAADAVAPFPLNPLIQLHQQAKPAEGEPAGLLEGTAGAELATEGTTATAWDACLLLT
ncbi:hypothetical protein Rhe02_81370 [Rhizocola hellebori]|uniref:Lanthionine synthetase n=1 Tax=Rhizocola hellebori TaxID=1392758 RepID=A0A8J3QI13_9ACTN|nr:lanthionine synthetase C family protein [Rhizocola hellebori]GIH10070.1 hypothetical protein Rhe02_81370 [Rhizocola hellebori]